MWGRVWASAKLAAALVVVGIIIIISLGTGGCRPGPEGNGMVEQSSPPHPAPTSEEASDDPFLAITRDTFDELVLKADKPVVVIFTSRKCSVCSKAEERIVAVANRFKGSVDFCRATKRTAPELVMEFKVHSFPTVVLFAEGEQVDRWRGLAAKELEAELERLLEKSK